MGVQDASLQRRVTGAGVKGDAMSSSNWRAPAAYADNEHISAAGFAWEYLRRDPEYQRAFRLVSATASLDEATRNAFCERWGLRFPG